MAKNLHAEPFDVGTITKLEIFEDYAQAWIPTFVMQPYTSTVCIFDFFAGTGYDINGVAGSPIRILQKIKEQIHHIVEKKVKLIVYLNEFEPNKKKQEKFELLKKACLDYLDNNQDVKNAIEIKYYNEDFENLFPKLINEIKIFPSLVYLDQNGIRFLADKYLLELEKTKKTDFLYFISSSYFLRFSEQEEFKSHVDIDISAAKGNSKSIHRVVTEELRKKLTSNTELKLYPFSIEKKQNVYGIIFGASHPKAVDKFLSLAWNKNKLNGEADFDIDDDITKKTQMDIFSPKRLTKIELFKENVKEKVLAKEITNNFELYNFTLEEGHIGSHAAECLKEMKSNGEINFDGKSPLVTYDNVYKNKKQIDYKVLKNENK